MNVRLPEGEVVLAIRPSLIRRGISVAAMLAAAAIFLYGAVGSEVQALWWRAVLVVMGAGLLTLAWAFWQATAVSLELTRTELRDSNGRRLFALQHLVRVDRGIFSMKPSNGLSIILDRPGEFAWQPGLWWRMGTRVGVGGATAPSQARAIADVIALLNAERDRTGSGI